MAWRIEADESLFLFPTRISRTLEGRNAPRRPVCIDKTLRFHPPWPVLGKRALLQLGRLCTPRKPLYHGFALSYRASYTPFALQPVLLFLFNRLLA